MDISPFIAELPKVELHVHIEGTLTAELRWALAQRNGISLGPNITSLAALQATYAAVYTHRPELTGRLPGVPTFLEAYYGGCEVLQTEDDFFDLAMAYLQRCAAMRVRYCEPFFDLQAHTRRGVPAETVFRGLHRAQQQARRPPEGLGKSGSSCNSTINSSGGGLGVESRWTLCFLRDEPVEAALQTYEAVTRAWGPESHGGCGFIYAVGLDSNAYERPPLLFETLWQRAVSDGFHVTMHCDYGQKDTHEHVHQAIFDVRGGRGAERIDHGLDAADSPELWQQGLLARGIGLTLCPHAYHRRTATEVLFPQIRRLWDVGVRFCINSDDPAYMHDVWVDGNLQKVYTHCGFSKADMVQLVRNGVDMSWADKSTKASIHAELDGVNIVEDEEKRNGEWKGPQKCP